jgi:hypothetical protein
MNANNVVSASCNICIGMLAMVGLSASWMITESAVYAQAIPSPLSTPTGPARGVALAPASRKELQSYLQQAGLAICFLVKREVIYKTALAANTSALMLLLKEKHGNMVAPSTVPLEARKLAANLSFDISIQAINSCPKVIPQSVRDEVRRLSQKLQQSSKANPGVTDVK